uniref:Chordin-like 2 n=1 Tax=Astyanax mexicanus TaxID=7994 RepID=A0A8B9JGG6_ASTMX
VYQTGETFTNHDLFPSRQFNQCVMCTCSSGNIFCALKTCQPITCSSPVSVPETCCLVCKDILEIRGVHKHLEILYCLLKCYYMSFNSRLFVEACVYSGKTYSHGDVWHPVLGKVLECILCTCRDGLQECRRVTCPSQYPCKHPVKIEGKCCKICPVVTLWVLHLMETGDVEKKDLIERPENYVLLTTLDEGESTYPFCLSF